jgi:Na+/H+-translocating membrane pyrophosphatase
MGIKIGGGIPSPPPDRSSDSSRKIEIKGKGVPSSSPTSSKMPASGDHLKTTDAEKAAQTCDTCGGPYRDKSGVKGPEVIKDGVSTKTCRSCAKTARKKL